MTDKMADQAKAQAAWWAIPHHDQRSVIESMNQIKSINMADAIEAAQALLGVMVVGPNPCDDPGADWECKYCQSRQQDDGQCERCGSDQSDSEEDQKRRGQVARKAIAVWEKKHDRKWLHEQKTSVPRWMYDVCDRFDVVVDHKAPRKEPGSAPVVAELEKRPGIREALAIVLGDQELTFGLIMAGLERGLVPRAVLSEHFVYYVLMNNPEFEQNVATGIFRCHGLAPDDEADGS